MEGMSSLPSKPYFTISVLTKNRAHLLQQCLESILNQSFIDFELLVIDDHSNDETALIIEGYDDSRIHYLINKGYGRSDANNTGLDHAKGKYLCFCDDDDWWGPDFLKHFYDAIQSNPSRQVIYRTGILLHRDGKTIAFEGYDVKKHQNPIQFVCTVMCGLVSLCIPIEAIGKLRLVSHYYLWEDSYFMLQLFLETNIDLIQLPNYDYHYRHHAGMGSVVLLESHLEERLADTTAQMTDLFSIYGADLRGNVSPSMLSFLKAEKSMEYALRAKHFKQRLAFVRKSLGYGFYFKLWRYYVGVLRS